MQTLKSPWDRQPAGISEIGQPSLESINIKLFTKHPYDRLHSCQL